MKAKSSCCAVLFFLGALRLVAAVAPENIGGFLLQSAEGNMAHGHFASAVVLATDGSFTRLYSGGVSTSGEPYRLSDPDTGTYRYHRLDDTQAELTWIASDGRERTETLTFDSATTASSQLPGVWTSYRLTPLDAALVWTNASNRSFIRPGGVAFSGFVLTEQRTVLVRAIGPGLKKFGVAECLRTPRLKLLGARMPWALENTDWRAESELSVSRTSAFLGAFPLASDSHDAALISQLYPGAYTAQVSSTDSTDSGEAMIEIYLLP